MAHSNPDLTLFVMLWWDLKRIVHKQMRAKLNEPEHCKEM